MKMQNPYKKCPKCNGTGKFVKVWNPATDVGYPVDCDECGTTGKVRRFVTRIPNPGAKPGSVIIEND